MKYTVLPAGRREEKFDGAGQAHARSDAWQDCPTDWREPFLPEPGDWASYPALDELFAYNGSGVMPGRTWIIAPMPHRLKERWNRLQSERDPDVRRCSFIRSCAKESLRAGKPQSTKSLGQWPTRPVSVADDKRL